MGWIWCGDSGVDYVVDSWGGREEFLLCILGFNLIPVWIGWILVWGEGAWVFGAWVVDGKAPRTDMLGLILD